jgi:hypothetical protein
VAVEKPRGRHMGQDFTQEGVVYWHSGTAAHSGSVFSVQPGEFWMVLSFVNSTNAT